MHNTGHFDFGKNLRPVDFNGWLSKRPQEDPGTIAFWLQYWLNTYRYLINCSNDRVRFFSFDALCSDPKRGLEKLGWILNLKDSGKLIKSVDRIDTPSVYTVEPDDVASDTLDQAQGLYLTMEKKASRY